MEDYARILDLITRLDRRFRKYLPEVERLLTPALISKLRKTGRKQMLRFVGFLVKVSAMMLFLCFTIGIGLSQEPLSVEMENYISAIQSDAAFSKIEAAKQIINSAVTDQRVYEAINTVILQTYALPTNDSDQIDALAWLCKALATSGNLAHQATFETIIENADSRKLKKFASQSLEKLKTYVVIKAPNPDLPEDLSPEARQYINMIESGDSGLMESAAVKIFKSDITEAFVYDMIEEKIKSSYQQKHDDKKYVNALAWMCKALASSGEEKYRPTLLAVSQNAEAGALKRHAGSALAILDFEPAPAPGPDESVLVIYRNNLEMSLRSADILLDEQIVTTLKNKNYTWIRTTPGEHVLQCVWDQPPAWEKKIIPQSPPYLLRLEAQQSYYLQLIGSVQVYVNSKKMQSVGEAISEGSQAALTQAPLGVAWVAMRTDIDGDYFSTFEPKHSRPTILHKLKRIEPEKAFR